MSWDNATDGMKYTAEYANMIQHALGDGQPVQPARYVIFYDSAAGEYKARSGINGTIEDHGPNAAALINRCIIAMPTLSTICCLGEISVTEPVKFDAADIGSQKQFRFIFHRIYTKTNNDVMLVKGLTRPFFIEGLRLGARSVDNHDQAVLKFEDTVQYGNVNIGTIHGDQTYGKSVGLEWVAGNGGSFMNNHVKISMYYTVQHALYMNLTGDAWASINKFDLGTFEGTSPRQIHIKAEDTSVVHNNVVSGNAGNPSGFNPQSLSPVWTIKLETAGSGGIAGTTFRDFWIYSAQDEVYRADSGVYATSFIGGMPRIDLSAYWHDAGANTDFVSCYTSGAAGSTRYSKFVGVGQKIEHHTASDTLLTMEAGTVHTNLGAGTNIKLTLPQDATAGTQFEFVVMTAAQQLQVDPGAAGGIYINGAKQGDDAYIWADDEAESVKLVADGNGDWIAIGMVGTWSVV